MQTQPCYQPPQTSLDLLKSQFPGQFAVTFIDGARAVGLNPDSARNRLSEGKFPIPTFRQGGLRFIHLLDLAEYLDGLRAASRPEKANRAACRELIGDPRTIDFLSGKTDSEGGAI